MTGLQLAAVSAGVALAGMITGAWIHRHGYRQGWRAARAVAEAEDFSRAVMRSTSRRWWDA